MSQVDICPLATTSSSAASSRTTSVSLPPCRHIRIELGDPAVVKHTLDQQAAMYFMDLGYEEDVAYSNFKIGLSLFSVLLTIAAQFYPGTSFLSNTTFIKYCVILFYLIQGVIQLFHLLLEQDCILETKPLNLESISRGQEKKSATASDKKKKGTKNDPSPTSVTNPSKPIPELVPDFPLSLSASLDRYRTDYRLTLASRPFASSFFARLPGFPKPVTTIPSISVTSTVQITEFFDVNGVFLMERFSGALKELVEKFVAEEIKRTEGKKKE